MEMEISWKKCNSDQWWNNNKCRCDCIKRHICEKDYNLNPATCSYEKEKCLASIIDDSVITCDENIEEESKTVTTNFNEINAMCKTNNFYLLFGILLITIALLIAVSIYCYLVKYKAKQKHLLLFYVKNNELKEVLY